MSNTLYLKPRTFTYGLSLGIIATLGGLLKILNYYPQSFFTIVQFAAACTLLIYPVVRYKNSPRPYLLPVKILSIALIILSVSSLFIYIVTMEKELTSENLILQIGEKLPRVISISIIFTVLCFIPLLIGTIIGFVIKKDKTIAKELLDDHLTQ